MDEYVPADWLQQMNDEAREQLLDRALQECHEKGVSKDSMLTLLFETGARWLPDEHHRTSRMA
jgi:hypothetical protein